VSANLDLVKSNYRSTSPSNIDALADPLTLAATIVHSELELGSQECPCEHRRIRWRASEANPKQSV